MLELLKIVKLPDAKGCLPSLQSISNFGPVGAFVCKSKVEVNIVKSVASTELHLKSMNRIVQVTECSLEGQNLRYLLVIVGF
jgi:carbon monoxide dehydrogenase subunit G